MPDRVTLILNSGGLRSLIATAAHLSVAQARSVILLHYRDGRPGGGARAEHFRKQAEYFGVERIVDQPLALPMATLGGKAGTATGEQALFLRPQTLLAALAQCLHLRAQRLVAPFQFNADHNAVARVAEQIILVQHLAELEQPDLPEIDLPLLELSDKQLVELGGQLRVPWQLAWSCRSNGPAPCGGCEPCKRRYQAFDAAGIIDTQKTASTPPR